MSIQTLKIDLATYESELALTQKELDNFEYEISEADYDDLLDSTEPDVTILGMTFSPSEILKNLDYTAYRCSKIDYEASFDLDNLEEYIDLKEKIADLEIEIQDLQDKIEDLENEQ